MITLFCANFFVAGSIFSVGINENQSVGDLKKVIKRRDPYTINCAADQLRLFLAKHGKTWLKRNSNLSIETITSFVEMRTSERIGDLFGNSPRDGTIHVLMVIPRDPKPALPETYHDSFVEIQGAFERQRGAIYHHYYQQDKDSAELPHKAPKSYKIEWMGLQERLRLEKENLMIDIAPVENGEAFWSEGIQTQVDAITKEADFDAFIAPYLNDVLAHRNLVFVKSAEPWLAQYVVPKTTGILKPHAFATHIGMYRAKSASNDGVQRGKGVRYGVAEEELYNCVTLFERNLTITDEGFGQVVQYLENLNPIAYAYGILFDRRCFWMIKSYKSVVAKVKKSTWVTKGSKETLQNFMGKNWNPCPAFLTSACSSLGVKLVEGDAFLGRGAFGYVFKVTRPGGQEVLALKVSCEEELAGHLYDEEMVLSKAEKTGLTVRPVGKVVRLDVDGVGAALLLSPVGTPLSHPTTQGEVQQLFELLWQLHNKDLPHGDPRVPNVIVNEGKLLWIDLFYMYVPLEPIKATTKLKVRDMKILTRSVLQFDHEAALGPVLEQLISNYGNNATLENVDRLAKMVHHVMNP